MIVYRCVSERDLANMMGIPNEIHGPCGYNTFKYEKNVKYKHFFYHLDAAESFMNIANLEKYYNRYVVIVAYDIDDNLLNECFGLGEYNYGCVPKGYKDSMLQFFNTLYFPEFAIPDSLITNKMIVGIGTKKRITPISYIDYANMYDAILKSERNFLDYEKWLFENGTNVEMSLVLENRNKLFPICDEKIMKLK